ncbi:MAG: hypothetical protein M3Q34_04640 [bacterium]|nr:hypothetical protein [bacterium]
MFEFSKNLIQKNKKESQTSTNTALRLKVFLALLSLGHTSNAQNFSPDSIPLPKDNIRLVQEILTTPEGIRRQQEAKEKEAPVVNFHYVRPKQSTTLEQIDSMVQEHIKLRKENPNFDVGELRIHRINIDFKSPKGNFNDNADFSKDKAEIRFSIGYHIVTPGGGSKNVDISGEDVNGDGVVDKFNMTDEEIDPGGDFLRKKKNFWGKRKLYFDQTKQHTILKTNEINPSRYKDISDPDFSLDESYFLTREKVMEILGKEEGQKMLNQVDAEYHRALELAHGHFTHPVPVAPAPELQ